MNHFYDNSNNLNIFGQKKRNPKLLRRPLTPIYNDDDLLLRKYRNYRKNNSLDYPSYDDYIKNNKQKTKKTHKPLGTIRENHLDTNYYNNLINRPNMKLLLNEEENMENPRKREEEEKENEDELLIIWKKYLEDLENKNTYSNSTFLDALDKYYQKKEEEELEENTKIVLKYLLDEIDESYKKLSNKLLTDSPHNKEPFAPNLSIYDNLNVSPPAVPPSLKPLRSFYKPSFFDEERKSQEKEKEEKEEPVIKRKVNIVEEINNISDLIGLCEKYPMQEDVEYNINMKGIHNVKESLEELNNLIGLHQLKENIVDQLLYFIQDLHVNGEGEYMHTVIFGPPGTGKTEVAKIMGQIYSKLGILKNNVFKKVTREDLVAGYLGQTAMKTKDVIKECMGGVLFIDEAYSLGNSEKKDSFAKESLDTLCEALSHHKKDFMCIIAGYENELNKCFFSFNEGLKSRFTWRFKIDDYKSDELKQIFIKKVKDIGWTFEDNLTDEWFKNNMEYFKYFGRDIETLLSKTKIAHGRRVFCLANEEKKKLNMKDLEKGLKIYLSNDNYEERMQEKIFQKQLQNTLYV